MEQQVHCLDIPGHAMWSMEVCRKCIRSSANTRRKQMHISLTMLSMILQDQHTLLHDTAYCFAP